MDVSRANPWTRRRLFLVSGSIAALLLVPLDPVVVAAQEASPVAEEEALPEGVSLEFLVQAVAEELPAAPAQVGLYRITIDPGASDEFEPAPGVELVLLEAGALVLRFEGTATVIRAGATGTPVAQGEVTLGAGDAFLNPGDIGFAVRNDGAESAQVLGVGVFPAGEDEAPAEGTPAADAEMDMAEGITYQPLAYGVATELPAQPAVLGLVRLTLDPGASAPPEEPHPGPELVVVESGSGAVTFTSGEAYVFRGLGMATPGAEPAGELAAIGKEITFEAGDAFFAQTGSVEEARNLGDEPAVVLVGFLAPTGHEEAEHGTPMP
ncbi:MAG: hypothetical protein ACRDJC_11750 [Thermomicrobiales bacterium]